MRNASSIARVAMRRLGLQRLLTAAAPSMLLASAVATLAVLALRAFGVQGWLVPCAVLLAAFAFIQSMLLRAMPRPTLQGAAAELDERLQLQGRVATTLALQSRTDAFALAAIEDGERVAAGAGMSRRVREAFRLRWPATAPWVPVAWIALALLVWMVPARERRPDADAPASAAVPTAAEAQARADQAESRVKQALQAIESSPEAQQQLQDLLAAVSMPDRGPDAGDAGREGVADAERREAEAAQRVSALEQRLDRELEAVDMQAVEGMRDMLARLPEMKDVSKELAEALKVGDFSAAMQKMESLANQAASGDPKSAEQAKKALESLASAMEKAAAEGSSAMQQSLKQAGMDPALAKNPAAAQSAIEAAKQAGQLSPQQAQQLQKQAQAQQQAQKQLKQMAQSTRECKNGSCSSARSTASRAQAQQRMNVALKMAMSQCRNPSQMGWSMPWQRNSGSSGGSQANGKGSGGGGKGGNGKGGSKAGEGGAPKTDGNTAALADGALPENQESAGDGNPLDQAAARDFVRAQGVPVGVSSEQVKAVAAKVQAGLEEGSEEDPVPGRLKAAHKRYFEQWKRRLDGAPADGAGATPATRPAPAGASAKPAG